MTTTPRRISVTSGAFGIGMTFTVLDCASCGAIFAVSDEFDARRRYDGGTFWCPLGHQNVYGGEKQQLEREIADLLTRNKRLNAEVDWERAAAAAAERSRRAVAGNLTKLRMRVQNGVCTECHRSFQNLRRHMSTKHPHAATASA